MSGPNAASQPDRGGHFGPYGGRYVPEVLMAPIEELETAYLEAREDAAFQAELADLHRCGEQLQVHGRGRDRCERR